MSTFTLHKIIPIEAAVHEVKSVVIDDDIKYIEKNDGVKIEGKISMRGDCVGEDCQHPFFETLDVDCFVPHSRISELNTIRLNISDFKSRIIDNNLHLEVKCCLQGEEHMEEKFTIESQIKSALNKKSGPASEVLLNSIRNNISAQDEEMLEKALLGNEVEIITTDEENIPESDESNHDEEKIEFPFDTITIEQELEVPTSDLVAMTSGDDTDEVIPFRNEKHDKIFDEDKYVVFSRFYRVKKDETYASIAIAHMIDVNVLVRKNNNKNLVEGVLIEL